MSLEEITGSIVLEKGEKVLNVWQGDVESTVKTVHSKRLLLRTKHKVVEAKDKENGALVLTNERMIWLKKRGVFSKSRYS